MFKLVTVSVALFLSLGLVEVALRIIEKVHLGDRAIESKLVKDPDLGLRLPPYELGHDANGFRNDTVPAQADIVALGDSQTWGVNVERADSWPQQLSRISGHTVYNMGLGGFGPVQYWVLMEHALKLAPHVIVVGIYLGNDLYDAYNMVYTNDRYAELREVPPPAVPGESLERTAQALWDEEKNFHNTFGRSNPAGWSYWMREHLAIGRLLNRTGLWPGSTDVDYEIDKAWATAYPEHGSVCDEPQIRTVFTTAYRLVGLDLGDPRITAGLRLTQTLLARTNDLARARRCRIVVLLIPSKESVYASRLQGRLQMSATYAKLVEMETRDRVELQSFCSDKSIEWVDALPALAAAIQRREQIYPSSTESHPNAHGYAVLAAVVQEELKKLAY